MHIFLDRISQMIRTTVWHTISFCFITFSLSLYPMGPGIPGLENLSPEEMQQLEQELQAAAQQIDAYVNSLSPEEQAEFQRAVAEVEQMMSSMSEEELGQFFEQIMAAEMEQAQMQGMQAPMQPQQPVTFEQKPAPVISKIPLTTAEEKALALLTSLIERTDELLIKTDNIPDMSLRFNKWASQNKLSGTAAATTWEQQKNNIIELRQQVSDLKKTDLKTGKYLFLEAFIKNSALYTQLEQLNTQLQTHEPRIVVSSFGIEKLSDAAKNALQAALSAYGATLQSSKTDIKKLFEEIGPELAKIKEEEKKITEKAQAESAKGRAVTPGRTAGTQSMGDMYGYGRGGRGDDYDFGGGYPYGDYGPSRGQYRPEAEKTQAQKGKDGKGGKTPKAGGKGKEETDKDKEKDGKDKKDKGDKAAKQVGDKKEPAQEAPVACPVDGGEKLNGKLQLIESNYRYIAELLADARNKNILDFNDLMQKEPNTELVLSILPSIERRLKRLNELVTEYTKQANSELKDNKNRYNEVMNKVAHLHAEQSELQLFGESLKQIVDTLKADGVLETINPNARYAYLKDSSHEIKATDAAQSEKPTIIDLTKVKKDFPESSLSSLNDIYAEFEKLNKAIPAATAPKKADTPKPGVSRTTALPVVTPKTR